jgi:hypothetical protein
LQAKSADHTDKPEAMITMDVGDENGLNLVEIDA